MKLKRFLTKQLMIVFFLSCELWVFVPTLGQTKENWVKEDTVWTKYVHNFTPAFEKYEASFNEKDMSVIKYRMYYGNIRLTDTTSKLYVTVGRSKVLWDGKSTILYIGKKKRGTKYP